MPKIEGHLSREQIRNKLKALAAGRYEDRRSVNKDTAFEAFGDLNAQLTALYDQLDELADAVVK